ncbi:HET-domain-containing protein [Rhizodiscina lignyota]|uniref:HET-domain-containing protein n=1 Tax=Rhizodiscina lignyota TaxID=1504668 RepID=A0A9P4M3C9_9PEZI|nr:HET-domain-containing protein [Rhizodiscina lignyota]
MEISNYCWALRCERQASVSNFSKWTPCPSSYDHPAELTEDLRLAKQWLTECLENHHLCKTTFSGLLPRRLVFIGDTLNGGTQKLITTRKTDESDQSYKYLEHREVSQYSTLSYCWGPDPGPLRLQHENLDQFAESIPWEAIPKTIQDAILISRSLKIHYLWVDALCIIQPTEDDDSDWTEESSRMDSIYSNAVCTISATSAMNNSEGCFFERQWMVFPLRNCDLDITDLHFDGQQSVILTCKHPTHKKDLGGSAAPLNRRAWTLQERRLSSRALDWTEKGVFFDCHTLRHSRWEREDINEAIGIRMSLLSGKTFSRLNNEEILAYWSYVIYDYSPRALTKPSDRLVALSGVAKFFQAFLKDEYLAGIWRSSLPVGLLWHWFTFGDYDSVQSQTTPDHQSFNSNAYLAPSWSWAATLPRRIAMRSFEDVRVTPGVKVDSQNTRVELATTDPTGAVKNGQLRITAPVVTVVRILGGWRLLYHPYSLRFMEWLDPSEGHQLLQMSCLLIAYENRPLDPTFGPTYIGIIIEPAPGSAKCYKRIGLFELAMERNVSGPYPSLYNFMDQWDDVTLV